MDSMRNLKSITRLYRDNLLSQFVNKARKSLCLVKNFMVSVVSLSALLMIVFATSLEARFATQNDATFEILDKTTEFNVKKDGSHESISSSKLLNKNERAREQFGTLRFTYNADNQMLDVVYARVTVDGKTYDVKPESIERKPVASNLEGFDDIYQVIVSFPRIQPGAVL